jgi:hypothetical protein
MKPEVVLIQQPAVNFDLLLQLAHQALGYSLAETADATRKRLSDSQFYLSCLAAIGERGAETDVNSLLLDHLSFGMLIVCERHDVAALMTCLSGLACSSAATVRDDVLLFVVSGSFRRWEQFVRCGLSNKTSARSMQTIGEKVLAIFDSLGLGGVWQYERRLRRMDGRTLLEDKRK